MIGNAETPKTETPKSRVRHAPEGYGFGRGGMLVRSNRTKAELMECEISKQLKRCGWITRKLKVREFDRAFYLNIGFLRGLDPHAAYEELTKLPNCCGYKRILDVLQKLPERVEAGASVTLDPLAASPREGVTA